MITKLLKLLIVALLTKTKNKEDWVQPVKTPFVKVKEKSLDIDWSFIGDLEGFELKGYVPKEEDETSNRVKSGVTVASGFDLGQHTHAYLDAIHLTGTKLKEKLLPYMGVKGKQARQILKEKPLTLTKEEALLLNEKVKEDKAKLLVKQFEKDSKLDFYSFCKEAQTVIMSVAFQYGNLKTRTPNFWKTVVVGDLEKMVWHLKNFGDKYKRRRLKEAKLLEKYLLLNKNKDERKS